MVLVPTASAGSKFGQRRLQGFRKRRDFGTAAEIIPGWPQAATHPARLRPQTKPDGRQGKAATGISKTKGFRYCGGD